MRLKSFGVVALALLMVMSFASLAVAEETPADAETTTTTIEPGTYDGFFVSDDFGQKLMNFVLYWGFESTALDETGCPQPEPAGETLAPAEEVDMTPGACLDVAGPNGQVNHGTFVSSFVHWLKSDDGKKLLESYDGPRGKLVKQAAKDDFGKGPKDKTGDLGLEETSEPANGKAKGNPHNTDS